MLVIYQHTMNPFIIKAWITVSGASAIHKSLRMSCYYRMLMYLNEQMYINLGFESQAVRALGFTAFYHVN